MIPKDGKGVYPGQQVLDNMGFSSSTIANTLKAQALITLANYAFTCWTLITQNPAEQEPIRSNIRKAAPADERVASGNDKTSNKKIGMMPSSGAF